MAPLITASKEGMASAAHVSPHKALSFNAQALFHSGVIVSAALTLERSAEGFLDSLASVSRRLRVSETLVALLTAGAEWEELAVVVSAVLQHRPSLALSNVLGSAIANILGGFSLGLLFLPRDSHRSFDASARRYAIIQLLVTLPVSVLLALYYDVAPSRIPASWSAAVRDQGEVLGFVLCATFGVYVVGAAWAIYKGVMAAPEDSDSDSDSSSDESDSDVDDGASGGSFVPPGLVATATTDRTPLLSTRRRASLSRPPKPIWKHVGSLFTSLALMSLAGALLAASAGALGDLADLHWVAGVVLLSFATTLPEKMLGVVAGAKGRIDVLSAAASGSNVFLLTLCAGVAIIADARSPHADPPRTSSKHSPDSHQGGIKVEELYVLCAASLVLTLVCLTRASRLVGLLLFAAYIAFVVVELTLWRR